MNRDKGRLEQADEMPKQAYSAPVLTDYGSVSKLTMGGGFVGNDGNTKCDTGQATTSTFKCS